MIDLEDVTFTNRVQFTGMPSRAEYLNLIHIACVCGRWLTLAKTFDPGEGKAVEVICPHCKGKLADVRRRMPGPQRVYISEDQLRQEIMEKLNDR